MTEQIRYIINELAKEPFKKNFTVITFDSLKTEALLQVLNDVLGEIDSSNKIDIRTEGAEDTIIRILNFLRILKYKPQQDDSVVLRNGLVSGNSKVIYPILIWLLPRISELQTRAYLAKYLVKVEVPEEIRADIEVEELFQQYEEIIENFKRTHKQLEGMKSLGISTSEVRKDITAMENESESVTRKIEKLKRQTESTPNLEATMEVIKSFRKDRDNAKELSDQNISQNQGLNQAELRIQRLQRQLKEIQQNGMGATPEGIFQRLEQDVEVAKYIVNSKLPKELEGGRKKVVIYENVISEASLSVHDLEDISNKIERVRAEINEMLMRRMMKTEDEKLLMFRQQAAIVSNRKEALIEKLKEARNDLGMTSEEEREKKNILESLRGDDTVKEEDFRDYVKNLRVKSTRYKQMKGELAYLKAETGILAKTIYILEDQQQDSNFALTNLETRLNIKGYSLTQENLERISNEKALLDENKAQNLELMSVAVQDLHDKINVKKLDLAPLVKNLNSLRQSGQVIQGEHESVKRKYDIISASIESSLSEVIKEAESLRLKYESDQLKYCKCKSEMQVYKVDLKRMQEEFKIYTSNISGNSDKKKSFKEKFIAKVSEQERLSKSLKEEEKLFHEKQVVRVNQAKMWKNLYKLMEWKIKNKENVR